MNIDMNIDWSKCPEATHFDPVGQNFLREIDHALLLFNNKNGWMVPMYTQYGVTIEDCHRPLIRRPPWDGEGLPPVGAVCEFAGFNPEETMPTDPRVGDQVTVIAHFMSGSFEVAAFTFYAPPEFEYLQVGQGAYGCFRPIRTPEQIAAEEQKLQREQLAYLIAGYMGFDDPREVDTKLAAYIFDHDYRKQVVP